ncbi:extracellular solute-binding protein [Paenibacillus filicis]|uniref:Extracellular solute-binding protein n=1 Tax=Paenibacillus gyeongsangnamensis TaxID=3388067 RepID=A0ABT4Q4A4_9BACL|nr:extracellular solute-binding protein [Paenibacillus filicis]MCZ8511641.1 extracellular solute-binding protein [Paenibacillus filicis]
MPANRRNKIYRILIPVMAMVFLCSSTALGFTVHPAYAEVPAAAKTGSAETNAKSVVRLDDFEPYYLEMLNSWEKQGFKEAQGALRIPGTQISGQSGDALATPGSYDGKNGVLIWKSDRDNWIEYEIDVPQDGLYQLNMTYHPYNDPNSNQTIRKPAVLSVQVDGAFPFKEARAVAFRRLFKDELPAKKDRNGDDIRPGALEIGKWMTEPFEDSAGFYSEPLKWYFSKGRHTIRLSGSDPIVIDAIELAPPSHPETYDKISAGYPSAQTQSSQVQILQAEEMSSKNDVAIQMAVDKDPFSMPRAGRYETFNTVGGTRWQNGGQTASWKFSVPESGRYKIAMRAYQGFSSNMTTYRTIAIDGKVPFEELLSYPFRYSSQWRGITLGGGNGKPYEFYLEKGEHVLSMTAVIAPYAPVIVQTEHVNNSVLQVVEELKSLTGDIVDKSRTWKSAEQFPELPSQLEQIYEGLQQADQQMLKANGGRDITLQTIETAMDDIRSYLKYPDEIPYHMDEIASMQERIGGIREALTKAPLQLDQIYIAPVRADFPAMEANPFQKIGGAVANFFYSFIPKDNLSNLDETVLNVWVNRGRDYVNLLQELSDQLFTPQYGIKVKVNLLSDENLLIYANAAGLSPDIALGQPQDKSIDFAMRNALLDLSRFPDFKDVMKNFAPGAMLPFFYNGGYYALPETQSFKVLYYRKDILNRLGLSVPNTWEDVYAMLPTLQQNGYNFYVNSSDYITFLYQNNAQFFTPDGMKTALGSPEAFKGFKQWVDLFHIYDIEKSVPSFYQHFRKGDMPIGVSDYNMYVTVASSAPELAGWWGIAPLPGTKQPDGTVARWSAGGQTTGFIYKNSKHKEEAWLFLKWLVSANIQEQYGMDLESFNGVQFRWNTANIEAFTRLPWPKDDMKVILEQWKWYKEMPNLPGSYIVGRELNNAWNRSVIDGMNYRESLEESVVNIDREMMRKQQEFGFTDPNGHVLHTLDLPQVDKPWEGVDKYVPK